MNCVDTNSTNYPAFAEGGVLVVSPVWLWRDQVIEELDGQEHPVAVACGDADALQKLERYEWKTLLIESELPDLDAYEVAELAVRQHPGLEVRFLRSSPQSPAESSAP